MEDKAAASRVYVRQESLPFAVRLIYFVTVGWWLTWLWIHIAWVAILTVIGLPVGLWMLNHVPEILTLKMATMRIYLKMRGEDVISLRIAEVPQRFWLWRLLYFFVIGWWASLIWTNIAWAFCATIIGLPLGLLMFSYLPTVTTLLRTE